MLCRGSEVCRELQFSCDLVGLAGGDADVGNLLAVAHFVYLDAGAEKVMGKGLVRLQADGEDHVVRGDRVLGVGGTVENHGALVADLGDEGVGYELDMVVVQQVTQHHVDRLLYRSTGGEDIGQAFNNGDILAFIGRQVIGQFRTGQTAADNNDLLADFLLSHEHVIAENRLLMVVTGDGRNEVIGTDRKDCHIGLERLDLLGIHRAVQVNGNAVLLQLALIPLVQVCNAVLEGMAARFIQVAAQNIAGFIQGNVMAGLEGCECCLHTGNPAAMREWSYGVPKTASPKKVAVIGGGIAGLVAAHTAARAGHQVAIYDKNSELGGHMLEIGCQSFKGGVKQLNKWYQRELKKLGVEINTDRKLCADCIKDLGADVIILATGSVYAPSTLPGADAANVVSAVDVMTGKAQVGEKVAVIGGGCVGGEIAYDLAKSGKNVTLIEKNKTVAADKQLTDDVHQMLNELLVYHGAKVMTSTDAVGISADGVQVDNGGMISTVNADTVVIATGTQAVPSLYDELVGCGAELYVIGDATGKRNTIQTASLQAYEIARML